MGEVEITLRVGDTLRIEGPDGNVRSCTVRQITAQGAGAPAWTTTTPVDGRVTLALQPEEPRTGTWAQDTSDGTPTTLRPGSVIVDTAEVDAKLATAKGKLDRFDTIADAQRVIDAWPSDD